MPYSNPLGSTKRFARILCEFPSRQSVKKSNDAKIHGLLTNPESGWRLGVGCMTPTADLCRVWVSGGATGSLAPCNLHPPRSAHIGLSTSSQRHRTPSSSPHNLLLAVVLSDDAPRRSHTDPESALLRSFIFAADIREDATTLTPCDAEAFTPTLYNSRHIHCISLLQLHHIVHSPHLRIGTMLAG